MTVRSKQVVRPEAIKHRASSPDVIKRARGSAGNHTMLERDKSESDVSTVSQKTSQSLEAAVLHTFGKQGLTVPIRPAAETLGAAAMTVDGQVNVAPGRFEGHSAKGISLLGHEIGHALQQTEHTSGDDSISTSRRASLESEAQAAGNALARGQQFVVQERAPSNVALYDDPTHSDIQQWEDDWNDAAFASKRRMFEGEDRPVGTAKQRYDVLCPLYFAQGIRRPLQYVDANIVPGHFFHFTTPVHRDLVLPLQTAEATLTTAKFDATTLKKFWGFNPRTTSEGNWSNHADGRAIDIDQETNPRFDNENQRRVISAITELDMEAAIPGADRGVHDTYEGLSLASHLFEVRYGERGLKDALDRLGELMIDEDMRISFHQKSLRDFPKTGLNPDERAMRREIEADLTEARERRADLVKDVKAVNAELKRFRKGEAGVATAEASLEQAEERVRFLEAAVNTATPAEARVLNPRLAAAERSTVKRRIALDRAHQQRKKNELVRWAETGFLTLPRVLVEAMKSAGFEWGGEIWHVKKDLMHFQIP